MQGEIKSAYDRLKCQFIKNLESSVNTKQSSVGAQPSSDIHTIKQLDPVISKPTYCNDKRLEESLGESLSAPNGHDSILQERGQPGQESHPSSPGYSIISTSSLEDHLKDINTIEGQLDPSHSTTSQQITYTNDKIPKESSHNRQSVLHELSHDSRSVSHGQCSISQERGQERYRSSSGYSTSSFEADHLKDVDTIEGPLDPPSNQQTYCNGKISKESSQNKQTVLNGRDSISQERGQEKHYSSSSSKTRKQQNKKTETQKHKSRSFDDLLMVWHNRKIVASYRNNSMQSERTKSSMQREPEQFQKISEEQELEWCERTKFSECDSKKKAKKHKKKRMSSSIDNDEILQINQHTHKKKKRKYKKERSSSESDENLCWVEVTKQTIKAEEKLQLKEYKKDKSETKISIVEESENSEDVVPKKQSPEAESKRGDHEKLKVKQHQRSVSSSPMESDNISAKHMTCNPPLRDQKPIKKTADMSDSFTDLFLKHSESVHSSDSFTDLLDKAMNSVRNQKLEIPTNKNPREKIMCSKNNIASLKRKTFSLKARDDSSNDNLFHPHDPSLDLYSRKSTTEVSTFQQGPQPHDSSTPTGMTIQAVRPQSPIPITKGLSHEILPQFSCHSTHQLPPTSPEAETTTSRSNVMHNTLVIHKKDPSHITNISHDSNHTRHLNFHFPVPVNIPPLHSSLTNISYSPQQPVCLNHINCEISPPTLSPIPVISPEFCLVKPTQILQPSISEHSLPFLSTESHTVINNPPSLLHPTPSFNDHIAVSCANTLTIPQLPHTPKLPHTPQSPPHTPQLPHTPRLPHTPCLPHISQLPHTPQLPQTLHSPRTPQLPHQPYTTHGPSPIDQDSTQVDFNASLPQLSDWIMNPRAMSPIPPPQDASEMKQISKSQYPEMTLSNTSMQTKINEVEQIIRSHTPRPLHAKQSNSKNKCEMKLKLHDNVDLFSRSCKDEPTSLVDSKHHRKGIEISPSVGAFPNSKMTDNWDKYMKKRVAQHQAIKNIKAATMPHYHNKTITKEEYKDIMRRAVRQVTHTTNKTNDDDPVKIQKLVESYVSKAVKSRGKLARDMKKELSDKLKRFR